MLNPDRAENEEIILDVGFAGGFLATTDVVGVEIDPLPRLGAGGLEPTEDSAVRTRGRGRRYWLRAWYVRIS